MRRLLTCTAAFMLLASASQAATLAVCTEASPDFLNPQFTSAQNAFDVASQHYNRLVELERGTPNIAPALAESWTVSPDGLIYDFKLRAGVKWHSNAQFKPTREFSADDVIYTFARMRDKAHPYHAVAGTNYQMFQSFGFDTKITAIEKIDDRTVRFRLATPDATLLGAFTIEPFAILSAEYGEAMMKAGTPERFDQAPIGTGPFQFVGYQKDAFVRFRAFPDYWAKAAGLANRAAQVDDLVFAITPDPAVRYAKLRAGECQVMRYPSPADLPRMRTDSSIKMVETSAIDYGFLAFNQQKAPFQDVRVRKALAMAVDRKTILDAVFQGAGTLATSAIPAAMWGHRGDLPQIPYDPVAAKALLAEAGYPNGFKTSIFAMTVTRGYMPNGRRAAELIQADFAKIGVTLEIIALEWGEHLKRARQGEHEIAMNGYIYDIPDPSQILVSAWHCRGVATGANRARWCNQEFSDLLDKAVAITDRAQRIAYYARAQEILNDEVPILIFANSKSFTPIRPNVEGYVSHVFGGQPYYGVTVK